MSAKSATNLRTNCKVRDHEDHLTNFRCGNWTVLIIRALIFLGLFGLVQLLSAQELERNPTKAAKNAKSDKQGTEKNPLVVKVVPDGKSDAKATREQKSEERKSEIEARIANATVVLAWITGVLAFFTALLWFATLNLARDSKATSARQAEEMARALKTAEETARSSKESADAALKSSMPVLFPFITDMARLHPLTVSDTTVTHDANIFISFDNYGKTPGIIRQVRADLFLTDRDRMPEVDFKKLSIHTYYKMVPGATLGKDQLTGTLDLKQSVTFSPLELSELLAEANDKFRRFALIGQVIYDDFFGLRHTSRFCVKMRVWKSVTAEQIRVINTFQIAHGGSGYNGVISEKIPDDDPFIAG